MICDEELLSPENSSPVWARKKKGVTMNCLLEWLVKVYTIEVFCTL